ncbi:hypothetical protein V8G54_030325 [Vigna mungo]|uniref:Transposase MuDR plant domain-containing protein n=1 Tax=Vigna mungo TaxID=3915 RepID=A0AAQ3MWV0_VIGMU
MERIRLRRPHGSSCGLGNLSSNADIHEDPYCEGCCSLVEPSIMSDLTTMQIFVKTLTTVRHVRSLYVDITSGRLYLICLILMWWLPCGGRCVAVVVARCGGRSVVVVVALRWWLRCGGGCVKDLVSKKSNQGLEMVFDICLYHMGKFVNGLRYVGGEIHVIKGIDSDRWSYFEAIGIVKDFKYDADFKLWWKGSKQRMMNNIILLSNDMEEMYLANYAEETKEEIDMYVEHVPSEALVVHFLTSGEVAEQECDGGDEQQDVEVGEEECDDGEERAKYDGGDQEEKDEMGEEDQDCDIGDLQQDVEVGEEECDDGEERAEYDGGDKKEKDEMGEEDQDCDIGDLQQDVEMGEEECDDGEERAEYDGGDEQDFVYEEEEGRNVVEGFVEASDQERLDDSEKDIMANDDDGFGLENARVEQVLRDINPVLERWNTMKKKKKRVTKRGNVGEGSFIINEEVGVDDMNEEYNSDELDSNVDSDEDERVKKTKFKKYRQDDMSKNFKFELGMEFCTLREFKNAVMEHSLLNGKDVKFVKNDGTRARAVCKNKCGFVIMASKVGCKQTFCVKTLVGQHNCGRVFGNKSANINWIAQVLTDRFVNVANMTVNQIIDDIKKSFSVGITAWKAGKAKQIALDSLVGDGERQYGRLYDYVGELLRVKCGTFKIKVNQPQPSLPPRFGSFYMCLEGCKQGFLGSCRTFIGVDGCHLKTTYGGQLLVVVARDPNGQYFPLAFTVVESECKESWRWFLTLLLDDIGGIDCQRVVMPKPRKRLDREVEKSGNWIPTWAGAAKFEVTHGHAVVAINYKLENPEDYVHPYYKKEAYVTCYDPEIVPINGQQLWSTSDSGPLLPPIYKTPPGIPKKLRRDADEYVSHVKLSKKNVLMKCSSCNEFGHNVRTCKRGKKKAIEVHEEVAAQGELPLQEVLKHNQLHQCHKGEEEQER